MAGLVAIVSIARILFVILVALVLAGCASTTSWSNLPTALTLDGRSVGVLGYTEDGNTSGLSPEFMRKIVKLINAKPLPVERVSVATTDALRAAGKAVPAGMDMNAAAFRCGPGDPPKNGCILIGGKLLALMDEDAFLTVIGHELGHIEHGDKDLYGGIKGGLGVANAAGEIPCSSGNAQADAACLLVKGVAMLGGYAFAGGAAHHSRSQEAAADAAGIERFDAAFPGQCGAWAAVRAFSALGKVSKSNSSLFANHPMTSDRFREAANKIEKSCPGYTVVKEASGVRVTRPVVNQLPQPQPTKTDTIQTPPAPAPQL